MHQSIADTWINEGKGGKEVVWAGVAAGGLGWPLVGWGAGTGAPWGASGGQVCPMRCRCGAGEAALLAPGRAAHTVTLKARQHARVLCDLQWKKF